MREGEKWAEGDCFMALIRVFGGGMLRLCTNALRSFFAKEWYLFAIPHLIARIFGVKLKTVLTQLIEKSSENGVEESIAFP
jgi:hypothetical protein